MKHHLNSLLQRKCVEFESANDARRTSKFHEPTSTTGLQTKDGYDWLHQIKQIPAARVAMH
jgi:hypothetical protein